jgi:RNA polymerase sigma-70 factor (ECF subfamily)
LVGWLRSRAPASDRTDADEGVLVARAQRDPAAFAPLYRRYYEPVCRFCFLRLHDWDAAQEATSVVFVRALAGLPRLDYREGSFSGWLFTIARNVLANDRRARRRDEPLEEAAEVMDTAPTPEEVALDAEARRSLRALLDHLPAAQRQVVELRLAGLTGAEIARALGRSHAAVRMLQVRALDRLQALLGIADAAEEARRGHP